MWNEREFERLPEIVSDDFLFRSPTAGTVRGRENVEAYARAVIDGFSDFQIEVHEMLAGENLVMTESTLRGTHDGEYEGIPPTHEPIEVRDMGKFVVDEGTFQEEHLYFDRHDFLRQLGLLDR